MSESDLVVAEVAVEVAAAAAAAALAVEAVYFLIHNLDVEFSIVCEADGWIERPASKQV